MSDRLASGFLRGTTISTVSGGTFTEVHGNLNQTNYMSNQVTTAEYNYVPNGDINRYNSPTIVEFGRVGPPAVPTMPHNSSNADAAPKRAGRGSHSGVRMAPYDTGRGSEQPSSQPPRSRTSATPGHRGVAFPLNAGPSRPQSGVASGSGSGFRNAPRNCWAYTPPRMPSPAPTGSLSSNSTPGPVVEAMTDGASDDSDPSDTDSLGDSAT
ncbi:hypothetical protein DFH07DRAFT_943662 [Mycena maculata]|uniref:Uncharacterized protein n=1 Tax=Mycena maculata TaxID=230809 RepID=A0AAD7IE03_9AGAR|nr:hypothetical protein DFH07DRAFT_943662 [Mycena maculata]